MKKYILFFILIMIIAVCLVSCKTQDKSGNELTINVAVTTVPTTDIALPLSMSAATTEAPLTSSQVHTTASVTETDEPITDSIPDELWNARAVNCAGIAVLSEFNENIPYDINGFIKKNDKAIYLFLPEDADLSKLVFGAFDSKGDLIKRYAADFSKDDGVGCKNAYISKTKYDIIAMKSSSPSLFIEIDEEITTLNEMYASENHSVYTYGCATLTVSKERAEANGWDTVYTSADKDSDKPHEISFRGRGNWTWKDADKKGYRLAFENKVNLLGMGSAKKWALIANVADLSLVRNITAYSMAEASGMNYTLGCQTVCLYINGSFEGAYLLSEMIDVNSERVDIDDLEKNIENIMADPEDVGFQKTSELKNGAVIKYYTGVPDPEDITGGYILEHDSSQRYKTEPCGFKTAKGEYFTIKSPEYCSKAQVTYIATIFQNAENAIYASNGVNPSTQKHYTEYIDLDSFVKVYTIQEVMKNLDGGGSSNYFYKPSDSQSTLIYSGPIWDFDGSLGNTSDAGNPCALRAGERMWYPELLEKKDFCNRADELWKEIFDPYIEKLLSGDIDGFADSIEASANMNFVRWENHLSFRLRKYDVDTGSTFREGVAFMKNFLDKSADWLGGMWLEFCK